MELQWPARGVLFLLGAVVGPVGDHIHVATLTTSYPDSPIPEIGSSPLWFPLATGLATVLLAELRLRVAPPRTRFGVRHGIGAIAAVLGTYALTGILHGAPMFAVTILIGSLAAVTWAAFGDLAAVWVGLVAAVAGPVTEIVGAAAGTFSYAADADQLAGVAPWLPALYFTFGVAAALLGELSVARDVPEGG